MALTDSNDPNKDFINALTYLGKGPFNIGMPGGSDISVGAGPAPAPGVNVGTFGQRFGGGPAESGAVGAGGTGGSGSEGSNVLGLLQKYLGAGAKGADFLKKLSGGGEPQGLDVLKSMAGGGEIGLGADTALSGLGTELPNTQLLNTPEFANILNDLQGTLGSSSLQDPTLGLNLTTNLGSEAGSATGGLAGNIGTGASGAGALAAILGAIASSTGSEDLAKAAQGLGAAGSAAGLAGTGASLAASGGAVGGSAAVGAAMAPIAIMLLADQINQLAGGEPVYDFGAMMEPLMGSYPTFGHRLGQTLNLENQDVNALAASLPYVQSQQDLQDLIGGFKSNIGQRVGGYGEGSGQFDIPGLPGATGTKHEWGQMADFGPQTDLLNQLVGGLRGTLPETGGAGGLGLFNTALENAQRQQMRASGLDESMLQYLDPATRAQVEAQFPGPTSMGDVSPYWTQFLGSLSGAPAAPAPGGMSPDLSAMFAGGGTVAPNQLGATAPPDVYLDWLKQQQAA